MDYDFDKVIDRRNTGSVKWDDIQTIANQTTISQSSSAESEDQILPMWVADMDFRSPPPVIEAIKKELQAGFFDCHRPDKAYLNAVKDWMRKRHNWEIQKEWIVLTPGVLPALSMLVREFTKPGDKVIVQRPVYYPFFSAIESSGCKIVSNSLLLKDGRYKMDLKDLEKKAADPDVKLAILCNPHNPVGRAWTFKELRSFGEICLQHNVLVIADEIHGDIIYPGNKFTPFANTSEMIASNAVICTSPSKTFNLAGLQNANIIIPNAKLKREFQSAFKTSGLMTFNRLAMVACRVAYEEGGEWLDHLMAYLEGNLKAMIELFETEIPQIPIIHPEATYLVWFDCNALNLTDQDLKNLMLNVARIYLNEGYIFGSEGSGFERINIATPRSVLMEALERIVTAIKDL